jgi:hypothetical protein
MSRPAQARRHLPAQLAMQRKIAGRDDGLNLAGKILADAPQFVELAFGTRQQGGRRLRQLPYHARRRPEDEAR